MVDCKKYDEPPTNQMVSITHGGRQQEANLCNFDKPDYFSSEYI